MGRTCATAALIALTVAQGFAQDPTPMVTFVQQYSADLGSLRRSYPNELLPSASTRMREFYKAEQTGLAKVSWAELDREGRLDHLLMANELEKGLRDLVVERKRWDEVLKLFPTLSDLTQLDEDLRRSKKVDPEKAAAFLASIRSTSDKYMDAMEKSKPSPGLASRVVRAIDSTLRSLGHWYNFYSGYDPVFTWWCQEPYKAAREALEKDKQTIREKILHLPADEKEALIGDPAGRESLMSDLQAEKIPYTPEELIAIGEKELAWCHAEMDKAAKEMGCKDWREALERVKQAHVEPGEQPAMIRGLALEAIDFLEKRGLVTIPPLAKETWRMEMMSPDDQLRSPFFLGGESILVSYPTDGMSHEAKMMSMRGNNRYFARATVYHELIPGHHLQQFYQSRYHTYRRPFGTPFWVEGWALYWELKMWDLGFGQTSEQKMGMLFWRAHRCARIVFSLKYHLGEWTPEQCVQLLVDQVGHEKKNAEAEVRRSFAGDYPPLYQLAYLIGGMQIRALHNELVPGQMTEREFHDTVLKNGSMPIAFLRTFLSKGDMPQEVSADWRFAG